jgi:hypothetical protein
MEKRHRASGPGAVLPLQPSAHERRDSSLQRRHDSKEMKMKRFSAMVLAGSALLFGATVLGAQTKTIEGDSVTMTATIEAIEQSTRTITIKDDMGLYDTIVAPPEMKRFSELKVGDKITARYYENLVVRLKKPGEAAVDVDTGGITRGTGAKPGATAATQRTITATIVAIDPKTSAVTVTGPNGWKYSRKVTDKKALAQLKVGDRLDITWTDALLISVDSAK